MMTLWVVTAMAVIVFRLGFVLGYRRAQEAFIKITKVHTRQLVREHTVKVVRDAVEGRREELEEAMFGTSDGSSAQKWPWTELLDAARIHAAAYREDR